MVASITNGNSRARGQELFWGRLLPQIHNGNVIPIIGPELLPYHVSLASELAERLEVPLDVAEHGIVGVADAFATRSNQVFRSSAELQFLLEDYREVPEVLQRLVSIDTFKLFVTTDYAALVERALDERGHQTRSFALRTHGLDDIDEYPTEGRYVYHLLGQFPHSGSVALARVDQLEYLYTLLTSGPSELLHALKERKHLLFLGCDFPEWLAGFFTRVLMGNPLNAMSQRGLELVACRRSVVARAHRHSLTAFLRDNNVEVYDGDAETFVHELVSRYEVYRRKFQDSIRPPSAEKDGCTFVSYLRADRDAVQLLVDNLTMRGIDVWFDRSSLDPGDVFASVIHATIHGRTASFMPVVSRASLSETQRFFIREWRDAISIQRGMRDDVSFIFPVLIDDMKVSDATGLLESVYPDIARHNLSVARGGRDVSEDLIRKLTEARKAYQRRKRDRGST